jgi:hypothetical protein
MIYLATNINNQYWVSHFYYNTNDSNYYLVEMNIYTYTIFFRAILDYMDDRDENDYQYNLPDASNINIIPELRYDFTEELVGLRKELDKLLFPIILDKI